MAEDLHKTNTIALSESNANVEPGDDNSIQNNDGFTIDEQSLCNNFGLKEEIAAQSLILSALSGQVQEEISQLESTSSESTSCSQLDLTQVKSSNIGNETFLQDERTNLSFRVSSEVGAQLLAIQQAINNAAQNEKNEAESLPQHGQSVLDLTKLITANNTGGIKTENDEECDTEEHTLLEEQIVNQLQVDLQAETARHSAEVGVNNFSIEEDEEKIEHQTSSHIPSEYITHPGNEIELLLENSRNSYQLFVASTANEAHEIIKRYAEETMSTFVSMRKMKQFGVTDGGIDLKKKNYRVFFESCDVEFDGIPYIYVADKMYICHLGKDKTEVTRQKIRQQSMEKRKKMGLPVKDCSASRLRTKKIDCPVKITVKMIAKFPQFQVLRKTKRVCETASKKVRHALTETNGQLRCYYSFVGKLPAVSEHNHAVGEETTFNEPIDPLIKDRIIQLTWEGVQSSNELRKLLDEYVEQELFAGKVPPAKTRRRYYPNVKDIRNYMNKAKMLTRFSPDVRNELLALQQQFQLSRPDESIILKSDHVDTTRETLLQIKTCDDEPSSKSTVIFCHQTSQQQRLLKRYGNQFVVCEVTNLIERVPFPMFCLFVQTNVDYQLVATFIVEMRNKESLMQGLSTIKSWNPTWSPKYITVDYSDDQMEAAMEVFPGSNLFISDVSRERSWRQWLSKADAEIGGNSEQVFEQFQAIANAYNEEELHNAALQLENSEVWAEAAGLRSWFNSNWLLEAKKWVAGYRPEDFFVALHNDAPIENDIKSLLDTHISFMKSKKLSTLIEHLVEKIVPEFYRRYVDLNHKSYVQANELKVLYGDQLPACLINKPASVIMYVLNQIKSTESTVYQVSHVQPGVFWVQDASSTTTSPRQPHTVSFGDAVNLPSCDCIDWQRHKLPCKHLCSVFSSFSDWGWDMLNTTYTSNSIINLDYSCIKPWIQLQDKDNEQTKLNIKKLTEVFPGDDPPGNATSIGTANDITTSLNDADVKDIASMVETDVSGSMKNPMSDVVNEQANNEVFILNVNSDEIPMLGALTDDRRNELAIQCHNLLQNLTQLSPNLVTDESLERLKSDLQASIGVLKMEPETRPDGGPLVPDGTDQFTTSSDTDMDSQKRTLCLGFDDADDGKRLKLDDNSTLSSFVNSSLMSDENSTTIENETVETIEIVTDNEIRQPLKPVDDGNSFSNENDTNSDQNVPQMSEQRERQLLAILTATSS